MKRQYVNLVLTDIRRSGRCLALRRIKSSSLFHPKKQSGRPTPPLPTVMEDADLPKPALYFGQRSRPSGFPSNGFVTFMPFGRDRDKIISADEEGNVLVYDTCQNSVYCMPKLKGHMPRSIPINIGDALYLISRDPTKYDLVSHAGSRALIFGDCPRDGVYEMPGWHWHPLPLPPYVDDPGYEPRYYSRITSSAVFGGNIWVSAMGIGTYSFNTMSGSWSNAGSWELPFCGAAEYDPEVGLWLGFSSGEENQFVCASNLSASASGYHAPTLCHVWREELATNPEDWQLLTSYLVRVDSGRFCIARFFHVYDHEDDDLDCYRAPKERFMVLTGFEVEHCSEADGGIHMVKHKSIRYHYETQLAHWVF